MDGPRPLRECVVLVTPRSFAHADDAIDDLKARLHEAVGTVRYNEHGRPLTALELREALHDVDGLLAGLDEIDAGVFAAAPRLRVVARYGVGMSNVDLRAAAAHGVVVTNTPGANAESVAELTIGFIFALARGIHQADRTVREGGWTAAAGMEVSGKTVGLLGLGRIGSAVARRAAALGCTVVAYDPYASQDHAARLGVHLVTLREAVAAADFLSLHLPATDDTRDLVNRHLLSLMKPGSHLINTARGELIVDEDLLWALEHGPLAGAALDAFRVEPPSVGDPLSRRHDVLTTPHIGARTAEAARAMGEAALHDLLAVLSGRSPLHPVTLQEEGGNT